MTMTAEPLLPLPPMPEHRVSDVSAFFQGSHAAAMTRALSVVPPYDPARPRLDGPGEPYHGAPAIGDELSAILGIAETLHRLGMQGQHIARGEWRDLQLRQAALSDRLALVNGGADNERAAIEAAWILQVKDCECRDAVLGEWQPDAIHWPTLTRDPASGCRDYVRQEYAAWRRVIREAHRAR
jgi:hypothetical protein